MSYIGRTNLRVFEESTIFVIGMKKLNYQYPEQHVEGTLSIFEEPIAAYIKSKPKIPSAFSIDAFMAMSELLPLSQAEWSEVLHISDRTLQRYIKDNKPFEGLHAEHLMQIEALSKKGVALFGSPAKFKAWLMHPKEVLGKTLDFSAVQSFWGVKLLLNELGRMAHGVYI